MEHKFTLLQSPPDTKDWFYNRIVRTSLNKPKDYSNLEFIKRFLDQGMAGFCHSFAGVQYKNLQENIENPGSDHNLSALYLASKVKQIDGIDWTEGSDLRSVFKALMDYGTVLEEEYPYSAYKPGSLAFPLPKSGLKPERFKIKNFVRLVTLDDMKDAIIQTGGFEFGLFVYDSFKQSHEGFAKMPRGGLLGGHAMLAVGYHDDLEHTYPADGLEREYTLKGFFEVVNSYGDEWDDDGVIYIPYEYFTYINEFGYGYFIDAFASIDLTAPYIKNKMKMRINSNKAIIEGVEYTLDQAPYIEPKTGRTMVPLRFIAQHMGYEVNYDSNLKEITLSGNNVIKMRIDSNKAVIDGVEYLLDQVPYIEPKTGRTMVPLRFVAQHLGYAVDYNNIIQEITLVKK